MLTASSSTSACSATSSTAGSCSRTSSTHRGLARHRLPAAGLGHRPAGRHLLLHVRDAVLHARRLPAALGAGRKLPRLRAVRDLLPAPGRGADHAPDRARAAVRGAAPREREPDLLRPRADDARAVPEGRARRRLPRAGGRGGLRRHDKVPGMLDAGSRRSPSAGQIFCDFAGYSTTAIGVALVPGLRDARQLPLPVRRGRLLRLLAALAHHACRAGCATISTSRSAATATARRAPMPR